MLFHDDDSVIPAKAPAKVFLAASAVTLYLDTHKNCVRGESFTMEATGMRQHGDPVTAAARRYLHLRLHDAPPNTPMCTYYVDPGAAQKSVTGSNIVFHLRATARKI